MARIDQTFSKLGYRQVDIGPPTPNLAVLTPTQRRSMSEEWLEMDYNSKFDEEFTKCVGKEVEMDPTFDVEKAATMGGDLYEKHVRKLNFDPTIQESSGSVNTVPIELARKGPVDQRRGTACMGTITLKALFLPNLKRTISATDGAIELLIKSGAAVVDGEGDEDDLDGLSSSDVDLD